MIKLGLVFLAVLSFPALAGVECTKTITGTTYCSGTDEKGNQVDTQSTTTNTGTTVTTGKEGKYRVDRECQTSSTGTTYCN